MNTTEHYIPAEIPAQVIIGENDYHEGAGISSSGLKLFARSPLHYWSAYIDPNREPRKETPALELGKLIHQAVLEPDRYFAENYALPRKYDRRLKDDKKEYEYHEEKAAEKKLRLITAEQHEICQKIAEGVHESPAAAFLFGQEGFIENSFYWHDWQTGVLCKARPDKYIPQFRAVLDLKSAEDASIFAFSRRAFAYEYHISAAFYMRGLEAVLGEAPNSFVMCAYEKEAPFACAFYEPDDAMLAHANQEIDRILARYAECLDANDWPGYPQEIQKISLPGWVKPAA